MEEKEELKEVKEELRKEEEEIEELRKRLKSLEEKLKKLENTARASNIRAAELQRELEYMKERYRKDLEEQRRFGHEKIVLDVLSVLDDLERALSASRTGGDFDALLKGVEMIYGQLRKVLEKHGVTELEVEGREFDPFTAEAVEAVPSREHPPNTVIRVLQKGYRLHHKVIRPARVVVSVSEEEVT